jgi:hypothetical protein
MVVVHTMWLLTSPTYTATLPMPDGTQLCATVRGGLGSVRGLERGVRRPACEQPLLR